ncbi:MAG: ribonucleoside-diphosphate reductase subunit alpha [Alphaproteobacteria bacterium]|nr:ribonucleoside-diphosphate reductase subunit alpha [Alphaproteobacteria bacterium]
MYVIKRNGTRQEVSFDKVLNRIQELAVGLDQKYIDVTMIARNTIDGLYNDITTAELDVLSAQVCASRATHHPDYSKLAARIAISNLHKQTNPSFLKTMEELHAYIEPATGRHAPYISQELLHIAREHADRIEAEIDHDRDFKNFDYFAITTLKNGYLMKIKGKTVERPQHMFMRVSLAIHAGDLTSAFETYHLMSEKYFTHATPTLFNAGTPRQQLASCFLLTMQNDSIDGIYKTLEQCAHISQNAGGIGLAIHNIRAKGTYIAGSRGHSDGIVPMLRVFNETARYVNQGGKRLGSFAMYLEVWHADIHQFLDLKKNHGAEESRARDLFYALWVNDLFMKRVEADGAWSLFCPKECPQLIDSYGDAFEKLYETYEREGRAKKTIKARDLWHKIMETQIETGTPYMLYKDACNEKSNQKNLGTIRSSNLCAEILEYTSKEEVAVCNLASISLSSFVTKEKQFDFDALYKVTQVIVKNINKIIDINYYPIPEARYSNLKHRPMGIGVQGLADTFCLMKLAFDEPQAQVLNKNIFETMYHAALSASHELACKEGAYESFAGSPASKGILQFDMWGIVPESGRYNWNELKEKIKRDGLRNSLMLALMPTASTGQILGNNESTEAFTSNLYVRRVLSGEFIVVNKHLLNELIEAGLWSDSLREELVLHRGSVQNIVSIPQEMRHRYRTVWEISQKSIIDMAADRGAFICQTQSMNIFFSGATSQKLTAMHFYAWKRGLKTGMYYLRNTPAVEAVQFTVDKSKIASQSIQEKTIEHPVTQRALNEKELPVSSKPQLMVSDDNDLNICLDCGS